MEVRRIASLKTADDFQRALERLGIAADLAFDGRVETGTDAPLARPYDWRGGRVGNRFAILPMEGVSLRPAFAGQPLGRKEPIFWEHEGNKAVRDGRWKLVQKWRGPGELYDLEADRTEQHDLIEQQRELAARLEATWHAWAKRTYVDDWPGPDHTDWGQDIPTR